MGVASETCEKTDCYASDLQDKCLLKKNCLFGICFDYYPKVLSENNDIFSHLSHKHNIVTRKISTYAIIISMISMLLTFYLTFTSDKSKQPIEESLEIISKSVVVLEKYITSDIDQK